MMIRNDTDRIVGRLEMEGCRGINEVRDTEHYKWGQETNTGTGSS